MGTSSIMPLQKALERLTACKDDPPNFVEACRPYLAALRSFPIGDRLLTERGPFIQTRTAVGTPYHEAWKVGVGCCHRIKCHARVTITSFNEQTGQKEPYEVTDNLEDLRQKCCDKEYLGCLEDQLMNIDDVERRYSPLSKAAILADCPGLSPSDLRILDFTRVPRPLFQLDDLSEWSTR